MDWYRKFVCIFFDLRLAIRLGKHPFLTEEVDSHSLNRANVDESMLGLRISEVPWRHFSWVNLVIFRHVLFTKELSIYFVNPIKLQAWFRLESSNRAHCLG